MKAAAKFSLPVIRPLKPRYLENMCLQDTKNEA